MSELKAVKTQKTQKDTDLHPCELPQLHKKILDGAAAPGIELWPQIATL